jgi:hypothetical protein
LKASKPRISWLKNADATDATGGRRAQSVVPLPARSCSWDAAFQSLAPNKTTVDDDQGECEPNIEGDRGNRGGLATYASARHMVVDECIRPFLLHGVTANLHFVRTYAAVLYSAAARCS